AIWREDHWLAGNCFFGEIGAGTAEPDASHIRMTIQHGRRHCPGVPPGAYFRRILFGWCSTALCRSRHCRHIKKHKQSCDRKNRHQETIHSEPPIWVMLSDYWFGNPACQYYFYGDKD